MLLKTSLTLFAAFCAIHANASTPTKSPEIAGWKTTPGITEEEAATLTAKAIAEELTVDEDGENCGIDGEIWSLEREKDAKPANPQRGEIFGITAYAEGPYNGCSGYVTYDCRVSFSKPLKTNIWNVESTYCEQATVGHED